MLAKARDAIANLVWTVIHVNFARCALIFVSLICSVEVG
jgi:hypothetical protein